jgi:hypothetical protein
MTRRPVASLDIDADEAALGEAIDACQGYLPECMDRQACEYDGYCFTLQGRGSCAATKSLDRLIKSFEYRRGGVHARTWLKIGLEAIEHNRWLASGVDLMRYLEINKRVRAEYEASCRLPKERQ